MTNTRINSTYEATGFSEALLEKQFVKLPRSLVTDGLWRTLQQSSGGDACGLLPVLALLCSRHREIAAKITMTRLSRLSGVRRQSLRKARDVLSKAKLLEFGPSLSRSYWQFSTGPKFPALRPGSFCFHGRLVSSGTWASLSAGAKSLAIAIAALARSHVTQATAEEEEEEDEVGITGTVEDSLELPDDMWELLEETEEYLENESGGERVRRFGMATHCHLAVLSGVAPVELPHALRELMDCKVVLFRQNQAREDPAVWFHLPSSLWAPGDGRFWEDFWQTL